MGSHPALDLTFALGPGAGTLQDMLYGELDAFEPIAIQEHESGDGWRVFFHSPAGRDAARGALGAEFGNALLRLVAVDIDDEDWARRSQATLTSVRVGRLIVSPPWDLNHSSLITNPESRPNRQSELETRSQKRGVNTPDPGSRTPDPEPITIVIDPSTGFGTGHHASTRLCLELLQTRDLRNGRVIDVGTGSGVLALAAWKLGAARVMAIDNDPDALDNARDNAIRNSASNAITISEMDFTTAALDPADLVIANLTGAILQRHAAALRRLVAANGTLIVSGFTVEEQEDVARAFGVAATDSAREGEWVALMFVGGNGERGTTSRLHIAQRIPGDRERGYSHGIGTES